MVRSISRRLLPVTSAAFVVCAIVQVFLAGLGVFDDPRSFVTHREFGYTFGWLTLAILILALVGRAPRQLVWWSVLLLVLFSLQSVFVALRTDYPAIAALHPVNGFLILGVAAVITRQAWAVRQVPTPDTTTTAPAATAGVDVG